MVALQAVEAPRSKEERTQDGRRISVRRFKVYSHDSLLGTNVPLTPGQAIASVQSVFGVTFGSVHPDDPVQVAVDYTTTRLEDDRGRYIAVEWQYEQPETPGGGGPNPLDFVAQQLTIKALWADAWRAKGTQTGYIALQNVPIAPNGDWQGVAPTSTTRDIGGIPMTSGDAVSIPIYQAVWTVKMFREAPGGDLSGYLFFIELALNKRNQGAFGGFAAGSLVYTGANLNRVETELYEVTHEFAADSLFHARQQAWQTANNSVQRKGDKTITAIGGNTLGTAYAEFPAPVHWVQPYVDTIAFTILQIPGLS